MTTRSLTRSFGTLLVLSAGPFALSGCDEGNSNAALETGGTPGAGGSSGSGGAAQTGGESSSSGGSGETPTEGSGGGSSTPTDCGIPTAGAAGVAKPSGTPGNLTVLNWAGFKGAVTYTFDDANSSQIEHYDELNALGVHMTFYLQTGKSSAGDDTWAQAIKDGHELGNHTKSHPETADEADIDAATEFIKTQFGVTPYTFAAPYGDTSYIEPASTRFLLNRGVGGGLIAPNGPHDPFNLPCFIPAEGAQTSAFTAKIDAALNGGKWQIILVHGFTGGSDSAYQPVDIHELTTSVTYAKGVDKLWIDSAVNIGAYWRAQKMLSELSPATGGDTSTWTWTLPDHFPPGKCLRVKVDGGTLAQNGSPLTWDEHGYYEMSLDAGSLTLSP